MRRISRATGWLRGSTARSSAGRRSRRSRSAVSIAASRRTACYVAAQARGLGVGYRLLRALVESAEADGIWTMQTGVFPRTARASRSTALRVPRRRRRERHRHPARGLARRASSSSGAAPLIYAVTERVCRSGALRSERARELGDGLGHEPVVRPGAAALGGHEPGVAQELQMVADRRLGEAGVGHEVADADLVGAGELVHDREARRVAERLEALREARARPRAGIAARRARSSRRAVS